MRSTEEILNEYTIADEERRLYMYLSHRDLRQAFTSISMAGRPKEQSQPRGLRSDVKDKTRLQQAGGRCLGWLNCCRVTR